MSSLQKGDTVQIYSWNFPEYSWGFKPSNSNVTIEKNRKLQGVFELVPVPSSSRLFAFKLLGSDHTLFADEDNARITLCNGRSSFIIEYKESIGAMELVKFHNSNKQRYLRHSNFGLRMDECKLTDKSMEMDSLWLVKRVTISQNDISDFSFCRTPIARKLFLHIDQSRILKSMEIVCTLREFLDHQLSKSGGKKRARFLEEPAISYPLQGAGGMDATALAISMHPCIDAVVSDELRIRIEEATTVKSRGGVKSFTTPSAEIAAIVKKLASAAISEMKRRKMFGLISTREFDLQLGFCEWVVLPNGHEIPPHRDGGNDCDVAAIFAVENEAQVKVEDSTVTLQPGQMYIFEPQKYIHSVSSPNLEGDRKVIALRFFRINHSN